jgi:hypothetical protein
MHSDVWYDLAIRELSELSDPVKEKLLEAAAETLAVAEVQAEEESAAPADPPAPPSESDEEPHRG